MFSINWKPWTTSWQTMENSVGRQRTTFWGFNRCACAACFPRMHPKNNMTSIFLCPWRSFPLFYQILLFVAPLFSYLWLPLLLLFSSIFCYFKLLLFLLFGFVGLFRGYVGWVGAKYENLSPHSSSDSNLMSICDRRDCCSNEDQKCWW